MARVLGSVFIKTEGRRMADQQILMQAWRLVIDARLKILLFQNLKAQFGFKAIKHGVFAHTLGNRKIAVRPIILPHTKGLGFLPKCLVVERFEPFFKVLSVFKLLHASSLSQAGCGTQKLSQNRSTGAVGHQHWEALL